MAPMLRRFSLAPLLVLAVLLLSSGPAWSHSVLDVATHVAADVPTAAPASTMAWSAAPMPSTVPWPAILGVAAALMLAWRRPRRALALAIVSILVVLAFENGLHSVHHLNQVRHLDDLRSSSTCPVAAATAHLAGTPVDRAVERHLVPTLPERVVAQSLLRVDASGLAVHQGRAPPLSA
jgi:hypothetical protein